MPSVYVGVCPICRICISKWMVSLIIYPTVRKDVRLIVQGVGPIVCTIVWTNK